jgi:hypothetical protein
MKGTPRKARKKDCKNRMTGLEQIEQDGNKMTSWKRMLGWDSQKRKA